MKWRVSVRDLELAVGVTFSTLALFVGAAAAGTRFVWNLSPSLPRGLYLAQSHAVPARGSTVTFSPSPATAEVIRARNYLPAGALLLKQVVATPGDQVCIQQKAFSVNGVIIGEIAFRDSAGRPLVPFAFCDVVSPGSAFVATTARLSFDSRYFGSVSLSSMTVVVPVWTF